MRPTVLAVAALLAATPLAAQSPLPVAVPSGAALSMVAAPVAPMAAVSAEAPAAPALPEPPAGGAPLRDAAAGARPATVQAERNLAAEAATAAQPVRRRGYGRSFALMVTGGALIVLGALAGGDASGILIIGGAVVGGIGLYEYLR